jgi:hypothetical protein
MSHAASKSSDRGRGVSRRAVLLSGLATLAAAGGGVTIAALQHVDSDASGPEPPPDLVSALMAERSLIASLDASMASEPALAVFARAARADHVAHAAALEAAVAAYPRTAVASPSTSPTQAMTRAALRAAEQRASATAAARAAALSGRDAALLASIAASEASHAELLR